MNRMNRDSERDELDGRIDYVALFNQYLEVPLKPCGDNKLHSLCPFHKEKHPSFWMRPDTSLWKCEGCGEHGNATSFLARLEGIDTKEAHKRLCALAGVDQKPTKKKAASAKQSGRYTVKEYALEKRLPEDFLASIGVKEGYGQHYVEIPYMDEDGSVVARRMRMPKGNVPRFKWMKNSHLTLYGLWRMEQVCEAGYAMLVEGESDTQTLWMLGIEALGIPGASTFKPEHAQKLLAVPDIYLHIEPDKGGQTVLRTVCAALHECGYQGNVRAFSCTAHDGIKDPSGVFIAEGDKAASIIWALANAADPIHLDMMQLSTPKGLEDAPIRLQMPPGYDLDGNGIYQTDPKTQVLESVPFSWTPILITKALNGEQGDMKLELAFKRNGQWRTVRYPRATLASARSITALAEYGMDVNSENGGAMVRWLSALERHNVGRIPEVKRASRYGWIGDKQFMPFAAEGYDLDIDGAMSGYAVVGKTKGDLDTWREAMRPHRERSLFRFIMAASFAAPLLQILGQRIFMVYNWGDSKGGKTAAMFAGLSAWGDPERMRMSFNTTMVGMERTVSFFGDLPLGLNERQLAGTKQEYIEKLVYMLTEGQGKSRGSKEGGLQQQTTWRSVILANGEVELVVGATATGVSTRALEIYGKPFTDENEAGKIYDVVDQHYGHAGKVFIDKLLQADTDKLRKAYADFRTQLLETCPENSRSHAASVAVVAMADILIDQWIWGANAADAYANAALMALEIMGMLGSSEEDDTNTKAHRFLVDWVLSNNHQFTDDYHGQRYGKRDDADPQYMLIFPSVLQEALEEAGYSYKKTMRWLEEKGLIKTTVRKDCNQVRPMVKRRINGAQPWMVCLKISDEGQVPTPDPFTYVPDEELPF